MATRARALAALVVIAGVLAGVFFAGRHSVDRAGSSAAPAHGSFADGYRRGREDAFGGYDGGWALGEPYIVTLRRGGPGVTYRFARRWPMRAGIAYRVCGRSVCSR